MLNFFFYANLIFFIGTLFLINTVIKNKSLLKSYDLYGSILTFIGMFFMNIGFYNINDLFTLLISVLITLFWLLVCVYKLIYEVINGKKNI